VVEVTADRTRVGPGSAATLTCTVTRSNPTSYTYSWTHEGIQLAGETSNTLSLLSFVASDGGTYSCEVVNEAGTGRDNVTIQLAGRQKNVSVCPNEQPQKGIIQSMKIM
jgi:hypothetical protein